jgi:hypothetical protein
MLNNKNIYDWIKTVLSDSVIRSDQNGPQPKGSYATFKIMQSIKSDFSLKTKSENSPIDNDIIETYTNRHSVIVDVNIYADNGIDLLGKLDQSRYLLNSRLILQAVDCSLVGSGDIRDLTSLGDTEFESRYQSEFTFFSWNTLTQPNQKILTVELKGKFDSTDIDIS